MTYIRLSACRATSLPGQPLFTCLLPPFLLLFFLFLFPLPSLPCFLLCKALLSSTFFAFSSAFLTFICLGISVALACSRPSLSLCLPLCCFLFGQGHAVGGHTHSTHTHTQVSSLFLSLCVCESRVGSLVCSRVGGSHVEQELR